MPIRAALFDFDGVIADTENIHIAAWQQTLARMGWVVTDPIARQSAELDDRVWLSTIFETRKIENGDVEGWCGRKQDIASRLMAEARLVYPGVVDLVHRLAPRVRLGVVSTTWRANIDAVLASEGLGDAFEFVVAKEDVAKVKPDPEGYALALARLGLEPSEVVALEDSATGIEAAVAAGIRVVALGHRRPNGPWTEGAAEFLSNLSNPAEAERVLLDA